MWSLLLGLDYGALLGLPSYNSEERKWIIMGLGVEANYAAVLSYYVTYICSVTLKALSETIPLI